MRIKNLEGSAVVADDGRVGVWDVEQRRVGVGLAVAADGGCWVGVGILLESVAEGVLSGY